MPRYSTIPDVKDKLIELAQAGLAEAGPDFGSVQVLYGDASNRPREYIMVRDTYNEAENEANWVGIGPRERAERYTLAIEVAAEVPGQSQRDATMRAFDIWSILEDVLWSQGLMSVPGVKIPDLLQPSHQEAPIQEGFSCIIYSAVRVEARMRTA